MSATGTAATTVGGQGELSPRKRRYLLLAAVLASAMGFINASLVNIALPGIQAHFSVDLASVQWVVNAYGITLGSIILVGGAAGDLLGRKRLFIWGLVVLVAASVLCAVSVSLAALVAARALQGLGAALMVPQGLALISDAYGPKDRGRAIGWWASGTASSTALGPAIGGFLIARFDWAAVFYVNLPLGLLVGLLAIAVFRQGRRPRHQRAHQRWRELDWLGVALLLSSLFSLTFGLSVMARADGPQNLAVASSPVFAGLLVIAGLLGLLAFVFWETRAANPIVPLSLFASRPFLLINLLTLLLYAALGLVQFMLPFKLLLDFGLSETQVGFVLLSMSASIAIGSRITSGLAAQHGIAAFLALGSALAGLACFGLALDIADLTWGVYLPFALLCLGMATLVAPLSAGVMEAAPSEQAGLASGVSNAAARLAAPLGIAVGVVLMAALRDADIQTDLGTGLAPSALGAGYRQVMGMAGSLACAASLLALGLFAGRTGAHRH